MGKRFICLLLVVAMAGMAVMFAGCSSGSNVKTKAQEQINAAKALLAEAATKGVQVPASEANDIGAAQKKLDSDSVSALILATTAKANIQNDINDAFSLAQQTYNAAKSAAQASINGAAAGSDLTKAKATLASADTKASAAKTLGDWYAADGPIELAQAAAAQAAAASQAAAGSTAAAEAEARMQAGLKQMMNIMVGYVSTHGGNAADYKYGINKINSDATWATGVATPLTPMPGSSPVSFLMHYEGGTWVLKAAPTWSAGAFGAPSDMVP
jgi:hypothetical protein